MITFLSMIFIAIAVLMVLVVLVQRGRGGGLAGAFGSGGGSSSAFGTKTGDVFTTLTVVLFAIFMLMAIWLNFRFQSYKQEIPGAATAPSFLTTMPESDHSMGLPNDTGLPEPVPAGGGTMAPLVAPLPTTTAPTIVPAK